MSYRKKRQLSETSEDVDDPAPIADEAPWEPMRMSKDNLPEAPDGFSGDSDDDDDFEEPTEGEQLDLPDIASPPPVPVARGRGLSSHSDGSDCLPPAKRVRTSSDDSDEPPKKIISSNQIFTPGIRKRAFSSQSESSDCITSKPLRNSLSDDSDEPSAKKATVFPNQQTKFSYPHNLPSGENKKKMPPVRVQARTRLSTTSTSADSADDDVAPNEKPKNTAMRMMAAMGYQKGRGLGKNEQGRTEPVEASKQRGTRGLGFAVPSLGTPGLKFDPEQEVVEVKETIDWLTGPDFDPPRTAEMKEWMRVGPKKLTIDDEMLFCDETVLKNVLKSKSVFDSLDGKELMKARSRANPFEHIRGVFFLNRAAMKMANMDAVFGFMFTNPKDPEGNEMLGPNDLLYFADVCAGPGGFTEYVLWKRSWKSKGVGFTLKGPCDFRLEDFYAASAETFFPYYGVNDDGDVYAPENINSLHDFVQRSTDGAGVHFMMADGGFSVEGQENIQEILSKRLYLCQCLVALRIVRPGGHFVVKLFDLFTQFSVGLIYLMYRCFAKITIFKPNTSRPANSERYLICAFKRDNCEDVANYMMKINKKLDGLDKTEDDVMEIVPLDILKEDESFYNYVTDSNNILGQRQVVQLLKIASFCEDPTMVEMRQNQLRTECLQLYEVPDKPRAAPKDTTAAAMAAELFGQRIETITLREIGVQSVTKIPIHKTLYGGPRDWMFCAIGSQKDDDVTQPTFFVGLGGGRVYRLEGRERWMQVMGIELPRKTLLFGELVYELQGGRGNQKKVIILHIIDACVLGGENIMDNSFSDRNELCDSFAKAIRGNVVRAKPIHDIFSLEDFLSRVECREKKNGMGCLAIPFNDKSDRFYIPGGLLFMSKINKPWTQQFSRSNNMEYFFNVDKGTSTYVQPKESIATFSRTFRSHLMWWWDEGVKIRSDQRLQLPDKLQPMEILNYVKGPPTPPMKPKQAHSR